MIWRVCKGKLNVAGGTLPVDGNHIVSIGMRFFMLFSVFYLSLFLSVGLLSARRAVRTGRRR